MSSIVPIFLEQLQPAISPEARILTNPSSAEFGERLLRWSDLESLVPAAIILPATEEDVAHAVGLTSRWVA